MIRTKRAHLHVTAISHPGMAGRENEDRFGVASFRLGEEESTKSVFAIVSDGIGGHRAGEVAAEMAVETISHMVAQSDGHNPLETLDQAIQVTSDSIAARAKDDTQRLGMGTTCACAWVIGKKLFTASVGDSRIYLLRNGSLMQLTVDHTWVQEAVEKGILQPEDARNHPNIHVIRRYLGSPKTPQADTRMRLAKDESDTQSRSHQGLRLLPGDLLLLCTDGLTDVVTDDEIEPTVRGKELEAAAQALIDLACSRDAQDNLTVVLMLVPWGKNPPKKKSKFWKWALIGLAALLGLAAVIAGATWIVFRFVLPPVH
ncbi:MAG TPA: protein phosphatase 2C domain-containing protein [Anaerolineales bacterium]|nr:protein phosphatase 2C domain-containing protein [Anaerolineales bacterium]